jgi:Na+/alanine symporter
LQIFFVPRVDQISFLGFFLLLLMAFGRARCENRTMLENYCCYSTFIYIYIYIVYIKQVYFMKNDQQKTFSSKKNSLYFPFIFSGKYFSEIVEKSDMSCYLMIISNLILNILIAIYFVLNLFFNFIP